jgi:hypothetical protein
MKSYNKNKIKMDTEIDKIKNNDETGDFIWCKKCYIIHLYEKKCNKEDIQDIIIKKIKKININDNKNQ